MGLGPGADQAAASTGTRRFKGSPTKATGTYRVRFTRAGTYRYECTIHLGMTGKVFVG